MSIIATIATGLAICFLVIQLATCALCGVRCRRRSPFAAPPDGPPVSLVRPLCGVESHTAQTLEASFRLNYPNFELLFCVARSDDPVAPLVRNVMRRFPEVEARLLVGEDRISGNPKLNNMAKGWREARYDHIVFGRQQFAGSSRLPCAIGRRLGRGRADRACLRASDRKRCSGFLGRVGVRLPQSL